MNPGRAYARRDCAGVRLRWTWRNGRLAANPKVVDLRVAGWSACLAVPKNGEPEGGGVVPMLGGPAVVPCEPSRTEPCERSDKASGVCLKGRRRKDKQRQEGTVDKGMVFCRRRRREECERPEVSLMS